MSEIMDDSDFGPAMRSLTPKMRRFVEVMVENPGCARNAAAKAAGFSAESAGALRVTAHRLMHDERVLAALDEVAVSRLRSATLMAADALVRIVASKRSSDKDKMKAAAMLLDRTGHGAAQTININKTVVDRTSPAMLERIGELATLLGLDATKLLGGNVAGPVVEGEFSEVEK